MYIVTSETVSSSDVGLEEGEY